MNEGLVKSSRLPLSFINKCPTEFHNSDCSCTLLNRVGWSPPGFTSLTSSSPGPSPGPCSPGIRSQPSPCTYSEPGIMLSSEGLTASGDRHRSQVVFGTLSPETWYGQGAGCSEDTDQGHPFSWALIQEGFLEEVTPD